MVLSWECGIDELGSSKRGKSRNFIEQRFATKETNIWMRKFPHKFCKQAKQSKRQLPATTTSYS